MERKRKSPARRDAGLSRKQGKKRRKRRRKRKDAERTQSGAGRGSPKKGFGRSAAETRKRKSAGRKGGFRLPATWK